jgi:hypothetical protein
MKLSGLGCKEILGHHALAQQLLEPDGQGHEPGHSRHPALRNDLLPVEV